MLSREYSVAWSDLDISRQSIMGLWNGKFIRATTPYKEQIFLAFGHDKHNSRVVFSLQHTGEMWFRLCDSDSHAKELATIVAYELMQMLSGSVMEKYNFVKVGQNNGR